MKATTNPHKQIDIYYCIQVRRCGCVCVCVHEQYEKRGNILARVFAIPNFMCAVSYMARHHNCPQFSSVLPGPAPVSDVAYIISFVYNKLSIHNIYTFLLLWYFPYSSVYKWICCVIIIWHINEYYSYIPKTLNFPSYKYKYK